jgi:hypothetical protein
VAGVSDQISLGLICTGTIHLSWDNDAPSEQTPHEKIERTVEFKQPKRQLASVAGLRFGGFRFAMFQFAPARCSPARFWAARCSDAAAGHEGPLAGRLGRLGFFRPVFTSPVFASPVFTRPAFGTDDSEFLGGDESQSHAIAVYRNNHQFDSVTNDDLLAWFPAQNQHDHPP